MHEVVFCTEFIGPIDSIIWQYRISRHHGMNFVYKSGFIDRKKRQHLKSLYFCHNEALSCCCWVFVRRVGEAAAPSSVPCLSVPLFFLEFVTWTVSWTIGESLLFNELHVQQFFLCKWGLTFFPVTYWGSVYSWLLNACEVFSYALTKVGTLGERLCSVMSKLTVFFLWCMFTAYTCAVDTPIWYEQVNHLPQLKSKLNVEMGRFP